MQNIEKLIFFETTKKSLLLQSLAWILIGMKNLGFNFAFKGTSRCFQVLKHGFSKSSKKMNLEHVQMVVEATKVFQRQYGKGTLVPGNFKVPNCNTWDSSLHGFPLGACCTHFRNLKRRGELGREIVEKFDAVDFAWDVKDARWKYIIYPAFKCFAAKFGNLRVHQNFVVPSSNEFPRETWGYKLGHKVSNLRRGGSSLTDMQIDELNKLGFIWNLQEIDFYETLIPAMEHFKKLYNTLAIPVRFEIPRHDPTWPKKFWNLKLGTGVYYLRSRELNDDQIQKLDDLGYVSDAKQANWNSKILPSLREIYQRNQNLQLKYEYIFVSSNEDISGTRIGRLFYGMCQHGHYDRWVLEDHEELYDMGIIRHLTDKIFTERVKPALQTYFKMHGHLKIPALFVVPKKAPWPEQSWNICLGYLRFRAERGKLGKYAPEFEDGISMVDFIRYFTLKKH